MSMARDDLLADLKTAVAGESARAIETEDNKHWLMALDVARQAMRDKRPLMHESTLDLQLNQSTYSGVPADLVRVINVRWDSPAASAQPWDVRPQPAPRLHVTGHGASRQFVVSPMPREAVLHVYGSRIAYRYSADHVLGETTAATTIAPADRSLFLLRAQAEIMRQVATRNAGRPQRMQDGVTSSAANSTPAALYERLLREFAEAA